MLRKTRHLSAEALYILLLGLLSGAFITLLSYSTSPLYPYYVGNDSAFFRMVGQAMTKGMLPYRDIFDMKGPYLFVIEYIGQLICFGRVGIFLLQIINLWLVLFLADRLCCLLGSEGKGTRLFMAVSVLSIAALVLPAGNYTEEFSLVPLFSCVYICSKFFKSMDSGTWTKRKLFLAGGWFGLMLGFLVFVRVTNASLIGGLIVAVVIVLIAEKHVSWIWPCAVGCMLGLFAAVIPPIAFFWAKGLLREFYEAVFVLGMRYSTEYSLLYHLTQTLSYNGIRSATLLVLVIITMLPIVFRWSSYKIRLMLALSGLFTFFAISAGLNFRHYYILILPPVTIGVTALLQEYRNRSLLKKTVAALTVAALILISPIYMVRSGNTPFAFRKESQQPSTEEALTVDAVSHVPDDERESIFVYNIRPYVYLYADIYPCIKYCAWQKHYIDLMPKIEQELREIFASAPPKWVLLKSEPETLPDFLNTALSTAYQEYYSNEIFVLHRLNEQ